ncbi:MAG: HD domain-containing protein [Oligoflexia bacterium]|nr:HD domain-containing protein [Oligoflexia bacterium]
MQKIADYVPFPLKEILPGRELLFDVYLFFQINRKMVLVKRKGDLFNADKIQDLQDKKILYFYIHNDDKTGYYDYKAQVFSSVLIDKNLSAEEKTEIIREKSRETVQSLLEVTTKEESEQIMENCNGITKTIVSQASNDKFASAYDKITEMLKTGSTLFVHSANVSSLGVMFAMVLRNIDPKKIEELAMAGLLHDLGLSQIDESVVSAYLNLYDIPGSARSEFNKHPELAVNILKSRKNNLSDNVFTIIMQHHECQDGSGFPQGLKGMQINYFAKILKIANDFDLWYRFLVENSKFDFLKYILVILQKMQVMPGTEQSHDPKLLQALVESLVNEEDRILPGEVGQWLSSI